MTLLWTKLSLSAGSKQPLFTCCPDGLMWYVNKDFIYIKKKGLIADLIAETPSEKEQKTDS